MYLSTNIDKLEPVTSLTNIKALLLVKIDHYSKPAIDEHLSLFCWCKFDGETHAIKFFLCYLQKKLESLFLSSFSTLKQALS